MVPYKVEIQPTHTKNSSYIGVWKLCEHITRKIRRHQWNGIKCHLQKKNLIAG